MKLSSFGLNKETLRADNKSVLFCGGGVMCNAAAFLYMDLVDH